MDLISKSGGYFSSSTLVFPHMNKHVFLQLFLVVREVSDALLISSFDFEKLSIYA